MRIFKLVIVLIIFMGLASLAEEKFPFIRETFTAFIIFLVIKTAIIVLIVSWIFKSDHPVK